MLSTTGDVQAQLAATGHVCARSTTMQDKQALFWLQLPNLHQTDLLKKT